MSLKGPKYINHKNIPWALNFQEEPEFLVYKIEKEKNNVRLHYIVEGRGVSIYVEDHKEFKELPLKVEVISGGWYGEKGRWAPLERYEGTIICENAYSVKTLSKEGADFKFKVKKAFFSSTKKLTIESEKIGKVEIKCKAITPQEFEILLFSKIENKWIPRKLMSFK
jgi:hypothetical protein